jgi:2-(1,2-epoxy-1,2-dihydrophenyl)acetyl-CoA isomerase
MAGSVQKFPTKLFKNEVIYTVNEYGVAVIKLNAPQRMNTMSGDMNAGVMCALELASDDPNVGVIVFTGEGTRAFCAGGNLQPDESGQSGASAGFRKSVGGIPATITGAIRNLRSGMNSSLLFREVPKPTIAAVNGACAGAGFSWACSCDIRLASDSAVFRSGFLTAGLSGDYGGTWTLPRIVGPAKAREIYFLNRKIRPDEAQRIGLVSDVYPASSFMDEVMKVANDLAKAPPLALKRIKANLNDADKVIDFSTALDGEAERHARSGFHPDAAEAGKAFLEKREPNFTGIGTSPDWATSKL